MKVQSRQQYILDQLDIHPSCSYESLGDLLGVSTMTVRRDAEQLARRGAVIKTLRGLQKANVSSPLRETSLTSRLAKQVPEKRAIANRALELIGTRRTLYLDGSTTCLELAKLLADRTEGLTIVTNSALVCIEIGRRPSNTVICIGGEYDGDSLSFLGPSSEEEARRFHVDLALLSTKGFVPAEGTFESSIALIRLKQIMAGQCDELVLMVDSSKFDQRALCKALDISQVHTVVTDNMAPSPALAALRQAGITLHIAPAEKHNWPASKGTPEKNVRL